MTTELASKKCQLFDTIAFDKHVISAPYHAATNGLAETLIQTSKQAIYTMTPNKGSSQHAIRNFLWPIGMQNILLQMSHNLKSCLDLLNPINKPAIK